MGNQFDFDSYNKLIANAGSGLQLHLAIGMLRKVHFQMFQYDNPLQEDMGGVVTELKLLQASMKQQAKEREERRTAPKGE